MAEFGGVESNAVIDVPPDSAEAVAAAFPHGEMWGVYDDGASQRGSGRRRYRDQMSSWTESITNRGYGRHASKLAVTAMAMTAALAIHEAIKQTLKRDVGSPLLKRWGRWVYALCVLIVAVVLSAEFERWEARRRERDRGGGKGGNDNEADNDGGAEMSEMEGAMEAVASM
jgi:hypothetical protein